MAVAIIDLDRQLDANVHVDEMLWFTQASRAPRLRTYREFAEQEIVLPKTGPHGGFDFKCKYQPYTRLWFDAIGSGLFSRWAATGPSQSGKTLSCFVIPLMFHLFEKRENVIGFAPNMEICEQKWLIDVQPCIAASRFGKFLPKRGAGSQGGFDQLIRFNNGTYLVWMTGGGDDKNKSAITAQAAFGTEVNAMKHGSETSEESGPINQIAARLRSHGSRALLGMECTVTDPAGVITQEIEAGSNSRIVLPCAHCLQFVAPEREDFIGWETATTEIEAEQKGRFYCPNCGTAWSPDQRKEANRRSRLIHRGQTITEHGEILGPVPPTRTLGFRWSAVNNQFAEESVIGREEWLSARKQDREAAEKERCQFVWAVPFKDESNGIELTEKLVASRLSKLPRYVCPDDTETLVCKIDLHSRWHYWMVIATGPNNVRTIVDYGIEKTPFDEPTTHVHAMRVGLNSLKLWLAARPWKTASGTDLEIDLTDLDAGYEQELALEFIVENGGLQRDPKWILSKGLGDNKYKQPKERDQDTKPGERFYQKRQPGQKASKGRKWWLTFTDTDHFMRRIHSGFKSETFEADGITRRAGSIALFGDDPSVHLARVDREISRSAVATQLVAWLWQEVETTHGIEMKWVPQYGDGRDDHWFDTAYGCLVDDMIVRTYRRFKTTEQRPDIPVKDSAEKAVPLQHFRFFSSGERPKLT